MGNRFKRLVVPLLGLLIVVGFVVGVGVGANNILPLSTVNTNTVNTNNNTHLVKQDISYTNPNSKISVFSTRFNNNIYSTGGQTWTSYVFYLPIASYVNVGMSGTIIADLSANAYTNWILDADGNQYGTYVDNYPTYSWFKGGYMGMSEYETFYLTAGWHVIHLNGQSTPQSSGYYTVQGSLSITAIPSQ
jgi:hypothetical protein